MGRKGGTGRRGGKGGTHVAYQNMNIEIVIWRWMRPLLENPSVSSVSSVVELLICESGSSL
jgi:hypothetical protein